MILPHPCLPVRLPEPKSYLIDQVRERHFKYHSLGEHDIGPILDRVRDVISGAVGHKGIPGRIQARGSAGVGSWRRILDPSGFGSGSLALGFLLPGSLSGNGHAPLRMMRSKAPTILLLTRTRTTAKRCTEALGAITRSDKSDNWRENMSDALFAENN